jgi:hypothetical protein
VVWDLRPAPQRLYHVGLAIRPQRRPMFDAGQAGAAVIPSRAAGGSTRSCWLADARGVQAAAL